MVLKCSAALCTVVCLKVPKTRIILGRFPCKRKVQSIFPRKDGIGHGLLPVLSGHWEQLTPRKTSLFCNTTFICDVPTWEWESCFFFPAIAATMLYLVNLYPSWSLLLICHYFPLIYLPKWTIFCGLSSSWLCKQSLVVGSSTAASVQVKVVMQKEERSPNKFFCCLLSQIPWQRVALKWSYEPSKQLRW